MRSRILTFILVLHLTTLYGQKTQKDLGLFTFLCFQENTLDSLFLLIPSAEEVLNFGKAIGIDSNSIQYKEFLNRYPSVIEHFKETCYKLHNDSSAFEFSWAKSKLEDIKVSEKLSPMDNKDTSGKSVTITIIDIYFTCEGKLLKLKLGDAHRYGDTWKPGNRITLERQ